MRVGVLEARNRLSELLAAAQRGEEVVITKRGEPVATLNAIHKRLTREEGEALLTRVRARRESLGFTTTIEEIRADIAEGRRY
ncbi:type II toxin-antitoxin system prevent-host-death family antitoxin [Phenylobacterium sp.]|uniref:type II toxin-antitoxin system Phd/YefM family antitoxin n=1 Tax=Phenylobacterium sp. TaxID=1871053 RepID=UPI00286CB4B2|nr:type II toxin-antitoxin system prevent-host-death family antitoxin [Phenylobacterium sp.]